MAEGVKLGQSGLQMGLFHLFVHPKWSRVKFAFLTHFSPNLAPKRSPFEGILGFSMSQKRVTTASKWAKNATPRA